MEEERFVRQVVLHAMALVMSADAQGRDTEWTAVFRAYRGIVGEQLAPELLDEVFTRVEADPHSAWLWLSHHARDLSQAAKAMVVRAAVTVSIADAELQDEELETLTRLARTLDVPGAELRALMKRVWQEQKP